MSQSAAPRPRVATEIRFTIATSSLGLVLVARSDRGLCAVLLGDHAHALQRELQERFPGATLLAEDAVSSALAARVLGAIEQPAIALDVALDLRGTEFQRAVWNALREIPPGTTASYVEIARRLDMPASARAVAQACAANAVAVVVPCHRVVRSDGALSGYRWGVERKQALLDREASA